MNDESQEWFVVESSIDDEFANALAPGQTRIHWMLKANRRAFRPPFDVFETDRHTVIRTEIAGMREEDISISLEGRVLHISGVRGDSAGKLAYHRMEINYGEFRLDIRLPYLVDQADIEASYDQGFLSVQVPRQPHRRQVPVTGTDAEQTV